MKTGIFLLWIGLWATRADLADQHDYFLAADYAVTIHGKFSIHNWSETVQKVTGELTGSVDGQGIAAIQSIRIQMEVRSIKSDMGSVMDSKTYKALKSDADPQIAFLIVGPITIGQLTVAETPVSLNGRLTLAGATRPVIMVVRSFIAAHGTLSIQGELDIKMTDFGVKPPSALFGAMKADPAITINFKTDFITQHK